MSTTRQAVAAVLLAASIAGCGEGGRPPTTQNVTATTTARAAEAPKRHARAPVAVRVVGTAYGRALADRRGFALYAFTHDRSRTSTCYGACAAAWPPHLVRTRAVGAGSGARSRLVGTVRRADGRLQVTYAGRPLYYYVGDRRPGQVLCQAVSEFGGTWLVVASDGRLIR